MVVFPSTPAPDIGASRTHRLEALRTETEAGYGMTRKKFTKQRIVFNLSYSNITVAEAEGLLTFFLTYQGTTFTYYHVTATTSTQHTVMFANDELKITENSGGLKSTEIALITI